MFRFKTSIEKQIQAAAILVRMAGGRMERLRLLKLLYIADREALKERGAPIIGGKVVALDHGPLHSAVLDLVGGDYSDWREGEDPEWQSQWSRHFCNEGDDVCLIVSPVFEELSEFEIEKLSGVSTSRTGMMTSQIVDETHELPEWKETYRRDTNATIPAEKILSAIGFTDDEIEIIRKDAEAQRKFDRIFG